ncbi:hypothetical protein D3C81_1654050 [compost metagenome]
MAAVDAGIGNEAKNMAGTSKVTDSHSWSTCEYSTAGTIMPNAPITPVRMAASLRPRLARWSVSQPPNTTPVVLANSKMVPSMKPACSGLMPNLRMYSAGVQLIMQNSAMA